MRKVLFAFALMVLVALSTTSARADFRNITPTDDPLGSCANLDTPEECMAAGSSWTCTNSYGCPQCALDGSQQNSICYTIMGNFGYCKCSGKAGYTYDKFGQKMSNCTHSGYCTTAR